MSLRSVLLAAATLGAYVADAHMTMESPVPFSVDKLDNGPLTGNDQWPCKRNLGFTVSQMNAMAVGEQQTLKFKGTAVHGGGSCQLAVTTDTEPTAESKWKVIESIEGSCPGVDGKVNTYNFELPDSIPNGKATFAWTWFAKLSGGPEMYMNCAPIEVSGGASDTSSFDALPDMLVANLAGVKTCKSQTSSVLKFPNPGQNLVKGEDASTALAPEGGDCGAAGSSPEPSGGAGTPASSAAGGQPSAAPSSAGGNDGMYTPPAGAGPTSAAATSAAGAPTSAAAGPSSAAATSVAATSAAAVPTSAAGGASGYPTSQAAATSAAATSGAGGVFAPGASSVAAPVASTQTTLVTVTGTPSTPSKTSAAASAPAATTPAGTGASGAAPTTAPAAGGSGGSSCTTNGAVVCDGPDKFGLCNNGSVVFQAVAAGTTCSNGTITKRGYNGRIVRRKRSFIGHVHKH